MNIKSLKTQFIGAIAMVLVAAIAMGSSTYAWFAMSNKVTATGMKVQAKAEAGLVISPTHKADSWSNTVDLKLTKDIHLLPASTADGDDWYHAHSDRTSVGTSNGYYLLGDDDDAEPSDETLANAGKLKTASENLYDDTQYEAAALQGGSSVIAFDDNDADDAYTAENSKDDGFYLLTTYYVRSSGGAIIVNSDGSKDYKNLAIKEVSIGTAPNTSAQLDKCLRIGVQFYDVDGTTKKGNFVVLAPLAGADGITDANATSPVTGGSDKAALIGLCTSDVTTYNANADIGFNGTIPANDTDNKYLTAKVYVWYEGEDATCISDNLKSTLDTLNLSISFKITNEAEDVTNIASAIA